MPDQTRQQDQHREQRAPGKDQDRNQQNMGNRDREPAEGRRFDQDRDSNSQDRGNRSSGNQSQGNPSDRNSGR